MPRTPHESPQARTSESSPFTCTEPIRGTRPQCTLAIFLAFCVTIPAMAQQETQNDANRERHRMNYIEGIHRMERGLSLDEYRPIVEDLLLQTNQGIDQTTDYYQITLDRLLDAIWLGTITHRQSISPVDNYNAFLKIDEALEASPSNPEYLAFLRDFYLDELRRGSPLDPEKEVAMIKRLPAGGHTFSIDETVEHTVDQHERIYSLHTIDHYITQVLPTFRQLASNEQKRICDHLAAVNIGFRRGADLINQDLHIRQNVASIENGFGANVYKTYRVDYNTNGTSRSIFYRVTPETTLFIPAAQILREIASGESEL